MSCNEFVSKTFEEICLNITDGSHKSPKSVTEGMPMASVKDMRDYGFEINECRNISQEDFNILVKNGCKPKKNDVLLAKDGNTYLDSSFVVRDNQEVVVLSSIAILTPDITKVIPDYLNYFLKNKRNKKFIKDNFGSGSAIPRIVLKDIKKIPILLPSLSKQKTIVDILMALDKKIELNNEINKTLEEMAQALFKRWFVEFEFPNEEGEPYKSSGGEMVDSKLGMIPKGWKVNEIGDICDIQNGFAFKAKDYVEEGIKVLRTLNIDESGYFQNDKLVYLPKEYSNSKYDKYRLNLFDIALVMVGAGIGKIGFILNNTENSLQNQNMWRFRSIKASISQIYLRYLVKEAQNISRNWSTGSAREFYRKDSFSKIKVIIGDEAILSSFNNIVEPIFYEISELNSQKERLIELRDSLLQKLMSGEIRVDDIKS